MDTTSHDHRQLSWAHTWLTSDPDVVQVPVASLQPGNSPRLKGESKAHTRLMVEAGREMPPIIVHRATMTVIDGRHRLAAAQLQHCDTIASRFFDGTAEEAFVLAVAANITHGLPLTPKERKAAAVRFLGQYPDCSDRTIAAVTGLTHPTVAAIRRRWSTGKSFQLASRRSKDGRSRPLSSRDGRQAAAELIRANQDKSLREIAREANVSRGTVRDVRDRLARGVSPLVSVAARGTALNVHLARAQAALKRLWNDPDVRSHEKSKAMLQLLAHSLQTAAEAQAACRNAPEHCRDTLADLAAAAGDAWTRLAHELRSRAHAG